MRLFSWQELLYFRPRLRSAPRGARWPTEVESRQPKVSCLLVTEHRAQLALFVLLFAAWVILARAEVVSQGFLSDGFVRAASWVVAGSLVLNTVMNATARTSAERWGMGTNTAIAALLSFVVAAG